MPKGKGAAKKKVAKKKTVKRKTAKKKSTKATSSDEGLGPLPTIDFASISTSKAAQSSPAQTPQPLEDNVPSPPGFASDQNTHFNPVDVPKVEQSSDDEALNRLLDPLVDDSDMPTEQEVSEVFRRIEKKKGFFARLFGAKDQDTSQAPQLPALSSQSKDIPPPPMTDVQPVKAESKKDADVDAQLALEKEIGIQDAVPEPEVKEEVSDIPDAPVQTPPPNDVHQEAEAKLEEARRYASYVDNLKRRLDMESRERHQQARGMEKELAERQKELEKREAKLIDKEFDAMKYDKQQAEIEKLRHELDDKKIMLGYKDEQLASLEEQLSTKQDEFSALQTEFAQLQEQMQASVQQESISTQQSAATQAVGYSADLDQQQAQVVGEAQTTHKEVQDFGSVIDQQQEHFEDELARLRAQLDELGDEEIKVPEPVSTQPTMDHVVYMTKRVQEHVQAGLDAVDAGNMKGAMQAYADGKEMYQELKEHAEVDDKPLYNSLLRLYQKIVG